MKLVGIVRARNAKQYIGPLVDQMKSFCDEVIVLDDQSTDGTDNIAKGYGAVLYRVNTGAPHHEGRDRRRLHELAGRHKADWVWGPDADDLLAEGCSARIRGLAESGCGMEGFQFPYLYCWGDTKHYRVDGSYRNTTALKLFKYSPDEKPMNREVHSMAVPREVLERGMFCLVPDVLLLHLGYMTPAQRLEKYLYYSEKYPPGSQGFKDGGSNGWEHILGREAQIETI